MKNVFFSILFGVAVFFLIITFSIGLPIYCRFFYYLQIQPLGIPEITGYDYETIKQAFDQVMDFLTLPNREFGTGVFSYTPSGKSHFEDCKVLFDLNTIVLSISLLVTATLLVLKKLGKIKILRPFGMDVSFISAVSIFVVFAVIGGIVALDFESAFVVFHLIFFPGKDNWQFSYADEIIMALPQQFFMNCAILIGASIILISLSIIVFGLIKRRKMRKNIDKAL